LAESYPAKLPCRSITHTKLNRQPRSRGCRSCVFCFCDVGNPIYSCECQSPSMCIAWRPPTPINILGLAQAFGATRLASRLWFEMRGAECCRALPNVQRQTFSSKCTLPNACAKLWRKRLMQKVVFAPSIRFTIFIANIWLSSDERCQSNLIGV
jgi:hypothetical protein